MWGIGPVVSYFTQVAHDSSSPYYAVGIGPGGACAGPIGFECLGTSTFSQTAVGGLLQYNFGPVTLQFWGDVIVDSQTSGSSLVSAPVLHDPSKDNGVGGYTLWFQASYALWTPPEAPPEPKRPLIYK